jgi:tRNA1(Val) A37 N6-methylase TrmN6
MDIQVTIPDEQGAALAQLLNIRTYTDANDLITQAGAAALLQSNKRALIAALAVETDPAAVDAATASFNQTTAKPIKQPPIGIKPA